MPGYHQWTTPSGRAEAAWIAEVDGAPAGCVFCVRENATTARLRFGQRGVDEVRARPNSAVTAAASSAESEPMATNDQPCSRRRAAAAPSVTSRPQALP